ncbi:hypothetical protein LUZ60_012221 [Juncus effusus]|nr:hypothetical protein LUZ60_012221 [Juncus effusus]
MAKPNSDPLPPPPPSNSGVPMQLALLPSDGSASVEPQEEEIPLAVVAPPPKRKRGRKPSKRRTEEKELVRVDKPSEEDYLHHRINARAVRISFDSLRLHYQLQSVEKSIRNSKTNSRNPKQGPRDDIKASTHMKSLAMLKFLSPEKRIMGHVPGLETGDVFFYRAEMSLLGIHSNLQAGIYFAPAEFTEKKGPVALSVVFSGRYEDDQEVKDGVLLYTGSGGKGQNGTQISHDQTLEKGNLALATSFQYGTEIRVIYGIPHNKQGPSRTLYIYDGLYRVVNYKQEKQSNGENNIFRFELVRIEGQEESGIKLVRFAMEIKGKLNEGTKPSGYLSGDISKGKEKIPVPFFNDLDSLTGPMFLEYLKSPNYPSPSKKSALRGCKCKKACDVNCVCRKRNGGTFAYDDNGILLQGRPIVYECGDTCQCPIGCRNRVTQKGMKYQLEVFRSVNNMYGVRSLDPIQAGTFICEISGDLLLKEMVPIDYQFYSSNFIDPLNFAESWKKWGDLSKVLKNWEFTELPLRVEEPGYLLDISRRVSVSGFIGNNEIMPNLFVQYVLYAHDNVRFPRMMVFALENIPPLRELCLEWIPVPDLDETGKE